MIAERNNACEASGERRHRAVTAARRRQVVDDRQYRPLISAGRCEASRSTMKKCIRGWLIVAWTLTACGVAESRTERASPVTVSAPSCAGHRYIGYLSGATVCGDAGSRLGPEWTARLLFPPKPWETEAPGRLARYCVFEWAAQPTTPQPYPDDGALYQTILGALHEDAPVDRDCPNVKTHGILDDHWLLLRTDFHRAAGAIGSFQASPTPVLVTLVDSWPDAATSDWTRTAAAHPDASTDHGYGLARLIEELTCPSGVPGPDCLVQTRASRALAVTMNLRQPQNLQPSRVGTHGYLSDLAAAVYRGLRERDTISSAPTGYHILNVSVGWSPSAELGGAIGDVNLGERVPAGAVNEIFQYAGCRGVLALAAAGNDLAGNGSVDREPIFPAAWTTFSTLDSVGCDAEFDWLGAQHARPLVQAVGAVVEGGQRMALTRADAEPAFTAYGLHAVGGLEHGPNGHTAGITGTSVSTAVVSAAAAATWAVRPSLNPAAVLDEVYASGIAQNRWAPLNDGQRTEVRKISVCGATEAACRHSGACAGAYGCAPSGPPAFDPAMISLPVVSGSPLPCRPPDAPGSGPVCGAGLTGLDQVPHTVPQPIEPICTVCTGRRNNVSRLVDVNLEMESSSSFKPQWLHLNDGTTTYAFAIDHYFTGTLASNTVHTARITGLPVSSTGPFTARVLFTVTNQTGGQVSSAAELAVR